MVINIKDKKQSLTIMKFGGSCLQDSQSFSQTTEIIKKYLGKSKLVIVTSAMKGITDELINLRSSFINSYTTMNDFNTTHGTWFASRYPEFATALTGGITSLQNINSIIMTGLQNYYWEKEEVTTRLKKLMTKAFNNVYEMTRKHGVDMRTAAYILAIKRIADAMEVRGIFP